MAENLAFAYAVLKKPIYFRTRNIYTRNITCVLFSETGSGKKLTGDWRRETTFPYLSSPLPNFCRKRDDKAEKREREIRAAETANILYSNFFNTKTEALKQKLNQQKKALFEISLIRFKNN